VRHNARARLDASGIESADHAGWEDVRERDTIFTFNMADKEVQAS